MCGLEQTLMIFGRGIYLKFEKEKENHELWELN